MIPPTKEEQAIVLDFLPNGYSDDSNPLKTPIAQALGTTNFTILELVPKRGIFLQPYQEVYIGEGKREEVHHIKGKIFYERLTATAKAELKAVVESLVEKAPEQFIRFFNQAQPLSTRMHQLELLPGLGKKHMWEILEARKEKAFESFDDLRQRIKLMPDPKGMIVKRIMAELEGEEKHHLFVG